MLVLRAERLANAAIQALVADDETTAARMWAEAKEAIAQARELEQKARAQ